MLYSGPSEFVVYLFLFRSYSNVFTELKIGLSGEKRILRFSTLKCNFVSTPPSRRTSLAQIASFEPLSLQIASYIRLVCLKGGVQEKG
jgi:hypothetical protein